MDEIPRPQRSSFLSLVNAKLRAARAPIPAFLGARLRHDHARAHAPMVGVWFRTRGCSHDRRGECTVCNYGVSTEVPPEEMVAQVRAALASLPPHPDRTLYVSPSGSMFDDAEVPAGAREAIFALVAATPCRTVCCETRLQYLDEARLAPFARILSQKQRRIETGLESASEWVLALCLNKSVELERFAATAELIHRHGARCTANVMVGMPLLTVGEGIEDAVRTVEWAFARGADRCSLFPLNVKRATTLEWLWRAKLYPTPSLWSLVEVLLRVGPRYGARVRLSWWYRDRSLARQADEASDLVARPKEALVVAPPATCPVCQARVLELLDRYRADPRPEQLAELRATECRCRDEWRAALAASQPPLGARLARAYEQLGRGVLGERWWQDHGAEVLDYVAATLPGAAHELSARSGSSDPGCG